MAIRLRPRDPSNHQVGNAILYGGERRTYDIKPDEHVETELFYIETDFGNHMKLNWKEVMEMFTVAGWQDYGSWREARAKCIDQPNLVQQKNMEGLGNFVMEHFHGST